MENTVPRRGALYFCHRCTVELPAAEVASVDDELQCRRCGGSFLEEIASAGDLQEARHFAAAESAAPSPAPAPAPATAATSAAPRPPRYHTQTDDAPPPPQRPRHHPPSHYHTLSHAQVPLHLIAPPSLNPAAVQQQPAQLAFRVVNRPVFHGVPIGGP
eukprot:CAMPEP_0198355250 /NCGR_PEP_ID=MMETSP1450-20131203/118417_1 /TAXON_ID=753684 ORGANISM="Madagascaria erythrocladiodes, Strain CCMP3234" /NCGR_SAMPLE_ID=MMETSP1450 /ASSEMBLY_ACC=CAM_ASM_001115 /LENGTH=158 /DNA_ID=CAMNT_0044061597 /DNA_START=61 /DNA_END=534 /DNA_ORIENTATION=-